MILKEVTWFELMSLESCDARQTREKISKTGPHLVPTPVVDPQNTHTNQTNFFWQHQKLGGGLGNIFYFQSETWGRQIPILTSIFFKWVGSTTN